MSDTGPADGWNGDEAQHGVTEADRYDGQLAPFGDLLFDRLQLAVDEVVLDVGCGCGATTNSAARLSGAAVGIDLSVPMLTVGRQRLLLAWTTSSSSPTMPLVIGSQQKDSTRSSVDSV